jgi:predicted aldo/keto reductase-like oxidoreductase
MDDLGPGSDPGQRDRADCRWYAESPVKASACVECGVCEERCPFDVEIVAKMREAVALFETPAA